MVRYMAQRPLGRLKFAIAIFHKAMVTRQAEATLREAAANDRQIRWLRQMISVSCVLVIVK